MTKQQVAARCYQHYAGEEPPREWFSRGGTVATPLFDGLLGALGERLVGGKYDKARRLATRLSVPWESWFCSEDTPSGGGGTITKAFCEAVWRRIQDDQAVNLQDLATFSGSRRL